MEEEERPSKLRKLDHEEADEQSPGYGTGSEGNVAAGHLAHSEQSNNGREDSDEEHHKPVGNEDKANDQTNNTTRDSLDSKKPISKNQLKKLRRKEQWEAGKEDRKARRKWKHKEKKERKRAERDENAACEAKDADASTKPESSGTSTAKRAGSVQLPLTFLIDCGFDDLMSENEIISLASQITRCYSANQHAPYRAHLMISSFGGRLRTRFETVLSNHHRNWKGAQFFDDDFVTTSEKAKESMSSPRGGRLAAGFSDLNEKDTALEGEVVYLTSESPDTLEELKPYSTYIIGGLVDRNRHKGICYKRAMDRGVKTAKLPIGKYMEMNSRFVLATNHVVEIMIKWLEDRDWAEAFTACMPKRKGGSLKEKGEDDEAAPKEQEAAGCDDMVV